MKTTLLTVRSLTSVLTFTVFLALSTIVNGQQAQLPNHTIPAQFLRAPQAVHNVTGHPSHIGNIPHSAHGHDASLTTCDTDLLMDYAAYDEVYADQNNLNYDGSWYDGAGLYLNGMSSYITEASGDSGYVSYVGVVFDTLLFSDPLDTQYTDLSLVNSTVYFDSLGVYTALSGDTNQMTTDSAIFLIYSLTNGNFSANPVKTIVYHGWTQLKQFYAAPGYVAYAQIPVHYQFTQGQGFAVLMEYHNKHVKNIMNIAYSYPDSCGTVSFEGNNYNSPAYPPILPGNEFYGSISYDTAGVVDNDNNTYGFFGDGFPTNCSFVYTQNWALLPFVTVCMPEAAPGVTITPTEVLCFGQTTGGATANATGGNGTFTYSWNNGATTSSISNIGTGTYTVTVTSNGQTATATTTITGPASAVAAAPTATPTCSNTGTASANASGGTPGYTYLWSNSATTATITGLSSGTVHVTVTDANGCSITASATVGTPSPFNVTITPTEVNCFGQSTGSAVANATGTTGTLNYAWSNGGSTQTISSIPAGTYIVTVTEAANGCTGTATSTITGPASAVDVTVTSTQTACGSNTGTAAVTASGGTPGYTYLWNNSATTTSLSNLGVGNYTVTVTDTKSCTATGTTAVNSAATYTVSVTETNVSCFGQSTGSATANVTGATGTVTYLWNNSATTQSITSVAAGTYFVTITDGSGCQKTATASITQPLALTASVSTTPTACTSNTGTASVAVSGGTQNYNYSWSNSSTASSVSGLGVGTISITVTDANSCTATASGSVSLPATFTVTANATSVGCFGQSTGTVSASVTGSGNYSYIWSNGSTTANIDNVSAQTYSLTVTDAFGCSQTATATVSQPNAALSASATATGQTSCTTNNGTATVTASNGTSPYSYLWSNSGTTTTINNLAANSYTVTVSDNNHCTATATTTVSGPSGFTASTTTTDATNGANGTATAVPTGGATPYNYIWSNGASTVTDTGLAAATYTVTITDANGCSATASASIIATGIDPVATNITNITLIPNPASDLVKVVVELASAQNVDFKMVDITGKDIYVAHETTVQGTVIHEINLGQYSSGIYIVEITAGNEVVRRRLVITK